MDKIRANNNDRLLSWKSFRYRKLILGCPSSYEDLICFFRVLSSKQKSRQNQEGRNLPSKKSPGNDYKFSQPLINFSNYVYLCRNERAQEAPDSRVLINFSPWSRQGLAFSRTQAHQDVQPRLMESISQGVHGQLDVRLVWGARILWGAWAGRR